MKWFNGYRMRLPFGSEFRAELVVIGFVAAVVLCGGRANADFIFGTPTNLGPTINSSAGDWDPGISADGLFLYFGSERPCGSDPADLWVTTRATTEDEWAAPVNLGPTVNSPYGDSDPSLSTDGLSLFFRSDRPGGYGSADLWVTTRPTLNDPWSEPVNLGPIVNSTGNDSDPSISRDGLSLYFSTFRGPRPGDLGGDDIWLTTRPSSSDPWGEPINLGPPVNTPYDDFMPSISVDGLSLFFSSERSGGYGGGDIWVTTRATTDDLWGEPVNLGPTVNSSYNEGDPSISADGSTVYFNSDWQWPGIVGGYDLWQVPIIPIVDFNGDGIVDAADMCIMVDHWGEYYPLCDIGPTPLGDGIVDIQDLIVLAEHLFEEIPLPFELVAYWRLDETEGTVAYNSVGDNHGILSGNPTWQPDSGQVAGALEFDGIDDYVETGFILSPADGAFSVFAWIKGGAPGQVIISQMDGTGTGETWVGMDALGGNLMTGLVPPPLGRFKPMPLESEYVITDGQWYNVGLVWDGSYRSLYVDGEIVAKDTTLAPHPLIASDGSLYIGAGKTLDAGSFFSGLIDDVRIYNVALTAEEIAALAQ